MSLRQPRAQVKLWADTVLALSNFLGSYKLTASRGAKSIKHATNYATYAILTTNLTGPGLRTYAPEEKAGKIAGVLQIYRSSHAGTHASWSDQRSC
jgi:hypothetical protein